MGVRNYGAMVGLGLYWAWLSLSFFSPVLHQGSADVIHQVEFTNFLSLGICAVTTLVVAFMPRKNYAGKVSQTALLWLSASLGTLGSFFMSSGTASTPFMVVGAALAGLSEGLLLFFFCTALARRGLSGEDVVLCFSCALVIASAIYLITIVLGGMAAFLICAFLPLACLPSLLSLRADVFGNTDCAETIRPNAALDSPASEQGASATRDVLKSFTSLPWKLILGLSLYGIAFSMMRVSAAGASEQDFAFMYVNHALFRAAAAIFAMAIVNKMKNGYWVLSTLGLLSFVFGLAAYWFPSDSAPLLIIASITFGFTCFELLIWVIAYEFYSETDLPWNYVFGMMRGVLLLAMFLTSAMVFGLGSSMGSYIVNSFSLALMLVMVLVSSLLFGSRDIASLWGFPKSELKASGGIGINELLQTRWGLTPREVEIAVLLTKGRSEPFIAEALFISQNTAHSHISHIYAKMKVHSRQEFLNNVESETSKDV